MSSRIPCNQLCLEHCLSLVPKKIQEAQIGKKANKMDT